MLYDHIEVLHELLDDAGNKLNNLKNVEDELENCKASEKRAKSSIEKIGEKLGLPLAQRGNATEVFDEVKRLVDLHRKEEEEIHNFQLGLSAVNSLAPQNAAAKAKAAPAGAGGSVVIAEDEDEDLFGDVAVVEGAGAQGVNQNIVEDTDMGNNKNGSIQIQNFPGTGNNANLNGNTGGLLNADDVEQSFEEESDQEDGATKMAPTGSPSNAAWKNKMNAKAKAKGRNKASSALNAGSMDDDDDAMEVDGEKKPVNGYVGGLLVKEGAKPGQLGSFYDHFMSLSPDPRQRRDANVPTLTYEVPDVIEASTACKKATEKWPLWTVPAKKKKSSGMGNGSSSSSSSSMAVPDSSKEQTYMDARCLRTILLDSSPVQTQFSGSADHGSIVFPGLAIGPEYPLSNKTGSEGCFSLDRRGAGEFGEAYTGCCRVLSMIQSTYWHTNSAGAVSADARACRDALSVSVGLAEWDKNGSVKYKGHNAGGAPAPANDDGVDAYFRAITGTTLDYKTRPDHGVVFGLDDDAQQHFLAGDEYGGKVPLGDLVQWMHNALRWQSGEMFARGEDSYMYSLPVCFLPTAAARSRPAASTCSSCTARRAGAGRFHPEKN